MVVMVDMEQLVEAGGTMVLRGGGGSGYTDGSVTVVNTTTLGGSTGNARVVLRVVT
jgi:hypothetical protein